MIAHNYCFSTCLGKVASLIKNDQPFKFGAGLLTVYPEDLTEMVDKMSISPCGVAFVPKSVREGILPKMLGEILNTRLMVKKALKIHKDDPLLQRILHSRQLGLKLISNVTYGYTSANFSGRMPCVEVADSVVSKGREILQRAISLVNSNRIWGGRVVYGDTDSLFVHLPGASKERAFAIGREIARQVTDLNPKPIKLKFEKVYLPCILQTKKRYAGYMYETLEQKEPVFDAKGIETVRRDGCPASSKLLEKSLKILFDTSDISLVKNYVQKQILKLIQGKISLEDLIFAKEFRGLKGYRPGACVPSLELARQWCRMDHRKEPLIGERIPYVIIYGAPRLPLIKLVRSPHDLLIDSSLRINDQYYAYKALLPPLHRCFSLLSVDVFSWYSDLPRSSSRDLILECITTAQTESIAHFFTLATCTVCGKQTTDRQKNNTLSLCNVCALRPKDTVLHLVEQIRSLDRAVYDMSKICSSCMGIPIIEIDCMSLDCPITYHLSRSVLRRQLVPKLKNTIDNFTD